LKLEEIKYDKNINGGGLRVLFGVLPKRIIVKFRQRGLVGNYLRIIL